MSVTLIFNLILIMKEDTLETLAFRLDVLQYLKTRTCSLEKKISCVETVLSTLRETALGLIL